MTAVDPLRDQSIQSQPAYVYRRINLLFTVAVVLRDSEMSFPLLLVVRRYAPQVIVCFAKLQKEHSEPSSNRKRRGGVSVGHRMRRRPPRGPFSIRMCCQA